VIRSSPEKKGNSAGEEGEVGGSGWENMIDEEEESLCCVCTYDLFFSKSRDSSQRMVWVGSL
jgi:hypothetical protein